MAKYAKPGAAVAALVVALSGVGLSTVRKHEGLGQPGRPVQQAYADPYLGWGKPTICYGHTQDVKQGDKATLAKCDEFLAADVTSHCKIVYNSLKGKGIWLTQGEQDAYCSFAFNLGKFSGTNAVYGRLISGDDWGACMGLLQYRFSNGVPSRGLWNRRYAEYNLCIKDLSVDRKGR